MEFYHQVTPRLILSPLSHTCDGHAYASTLQLDYVVAILHCSTIERDLPEAPHILTATSTYARRFVVRGRGKDPPAWSVATSTEEARTSHTQTAAGQASRPRAARTHSMMQTYIQLPTRTYEERTHCYTHVRRSPGVLTRGSLPTAAATGSKPNPRD